MNALWVALGIWLMLAAVVVLFVARGIALGQNAPRMPAEAEAWRHFDDELRAVLGEDYRVWGRAD